MTGPKIGIFWVHRDAIFGSAVRIEEGTRTSLDIIDAEVDHASFWESDSFPRYRFPELVGREYYEIARGRVLYDIKARRSVIYLDAKLMTASSREKIVTFFCLDPEALWRRDPHYVTE